MTAYDQSHTKVHMRKMIEVVPQACLCWHVEGFRSLIVLVVSVIALLIPFKSAVIHVLIVRMGPSSPMIMSEACSRIQGNTLGGGSTRRVMLTPALQQGIQYSRRLASFA